jgi:hypothetical protein
VKDSERKTMSESEVNERETLLLTMDTDSLSGEVANKKILKRLKSKNGELCHKKEARW